MSNPALGYPSPTLTGTFHSFIMSPKTATPRAKPASKTTPRAEKQPAPRSEAQQEAAKAQVAVGLLYRLLVPSGASSRATWAGHLDMMALLKGEQSPEKTALLASKVTPKDPRATNDLSPALKAAYGFEEEPLDGPMTMAQLIKLVAQACDADPARLGL
jgi:hypothetical protein